MYGSQVPPVFDRLSETASNAFAAFLIGLLIATILWLRDSDFVSTNIAVGTVVLVAVVALVWPYGWHIVLGHDVQWFRNQVSFSQWPPPRLPDPDAFAFQWKLRAFVVSIVPGLYISRDLW